MIGRRCINTMVRKDLLNYLLLLGSKRNFFSEYPIVSASTKGSNNLLLDLLCQNIGNSIKYSFYAPSQLNRFVATEERTAFSFLWIAKGIHNRNKWFAYSSLLIGKVSQTLWSMGTGLVLAQGKLRGNIKTHGLQYSIGELKVKVVKDSSSLPKGCGNSKILPFHGLIPRTSSPRNKPPTGCSTRITLRCGRWGTRDTTS